MAKSLETKESILKFLKSHNLMVLATVSTSLVPHAATVFYFIDDDFNFYFVTPVKSKKAQNFMSNRKVGISVGEDIPMSVQAEGKIQLVTDKKERLRVFAELARIASSLRDIWAPILQLSGSEYYIVRVVTSWVRSIDLTKKHINQNRSPFTEITLGKSRRIKSMEEISIDK